MAAFVFIFLASFIAFSIFIQTRTFGRVVTKVISDIANKKANTKVGLRSISLSLLPPGIEFDRVRIEKDLGEGKKLKAELGRLGFYIGLIELEERKLTLGEIRISDSLIEYNFPVKEEVELKQLDQKMIDMVFNADKNLPIRVDTILLENSIIHANHDVLEAKRLKVFKRGKAFMTRFHLSNLRPSADSDFQLDEVWGDAEITRKDINLQRLRIQHDVHTLLVKGKINNYPLLKSAEASLMGEASLYFNQLSKYLDLPADIKVGDGFAHINFNLSLKDQKIEGTTDLAINDLKSNLIYAKQVVASLKLQNEILTLKKFDFSHNDQKLQLINSPELYDFRSNRLLYQPITAKADKVRLGNALRYLPSLKVIKGRLSGEITFTYDGNYYFAPKDGFIVEGLGLVTGDEKPFTVLMTKKAKLTRSSFRIVRKEFQMESYIELPNSLLDVTGFVNSEKVGFDVKQALVDLEDFGNIAKLDIKGKGALDIKVTGPIKDVLINLRGQTENFEILGYRLGKTDKDISIELRDSNVVIHKFEALMRNTPISGTGAVNYENSDIALGINSTKATFGDLRDILNPIFSKLNFLPADLDLTAKIDANIFGKTSLDKLKVKADVQFSDLTAYGESFSSGNFGVSLDNRIFQLKDLNAKKGKGKLRGDFAFNLESEKLKLSYVWDNLLLADFNISKRFHFNLDGLIFGSIAGEGTVKDYRLQLDSRLEQTRTSTHKFKDSKLSLMITPQALSGTVQMLGKIITSDFLISTDEKKYSSVKLIADIPTIKPFASALLGQHLDNEEFSGEMGFNLDTTFRWGLQDMNLKANLSSLTFKYENFNINYRSNDPQFIIVNDKVQNWNLLIKESDFYVKTKGDGVFGKKVNLDQEFHFNSRIFELLLSKVLSSEGFVRNNLKIEGIGDKYNFSLTSKTPDLDVTLDGVPFPINNLTYNLTFNNDRLLIDEMRASLENGFISLKGDVFLIAMNPM